jgi:hypothetical protein
VAPEDLWYGLYLGVAGGWGWVAGGGIELMAVPHFSLRVEYLHAGFTNSVETSDLVGGFAGGPPVNVKERGVDIVRGA